VITGDLPPSFHAFDGVGSNFLAGGAIRVTATDPDGDPLEARALTANHVGDGGATFTVEDRADEITWSVAVPYRAPADAAFLIGGEGLERSVTLALRDVNGAEARQTWFITIGNRLPVLDGPRATVQVGHRYDSVQRLYSATAPLSTWSDPDGDPLFGTTTGDPVCGRVTFSGGVGDVTCELPYVGAPSLDNLARPHDVVVRAADPWGTSETSATTTVTVLNRPPVLTLMPVRAATTCTYEPGCCEYDPERGGVFCRTAPIFQSATAELTSFVSDPDGDPLRITVAQPSGASTSTVCEPASCAIAVTIPSVNGCDPLEGFPPYSITADDGAAAVTRSETTTLSCTP
jgi:hypothetical protein